MDRIVVSHHKAMAMVEADAPGLFAMVSSLSRREHMRVPGLYLVPEALPNALVAQDARGAEILLTAGLLRTLSSAELAAVIAHQISLIKNREALTMTIAAGYAILFTATALLSPIAGWVARFAAPHAVRFGADASGAHLVGDALPLVRALQKMEPQRSQEPAGSSLLSTAHLCICPPAAPEQSGSMRGTHPAVADRIGRLEALSLRPLPSVRS